MSSVQLVTHSLTLTLMSILGIGVDVLHTTRIAQLAGRRGWSKFSRRILSDIERAQFEELATEEQKIKFMGTRFEASSRIEASMLSPDG